MRQLWHDSVGISALHLVFTIVFLLIGYWVPQTSLSVPQIILLGYVIAFLFVAAVTDTIDRLLYGLTAGIVAILLSPRSFDMILIITCVLFMLTAVTDVEQAREKGATGSFILLFLLRLPFFIGTLIGSLMYLRPRPEQEAEEKIAAT